MKQLFPMALVVCSLAGCSDPVVEAGTTVFRDSAGVQIAHTTVGAAAEECRLADESLRIGAVEGDSAQELFGVLDGLVLDDGGIAILNSGTAQIRIFDPAGAAVTQFGRRGPGPGEFRNLQSLALRGRDTLVVGDNRPWRFTFITMAGEYVRSVELQPLVIERPLIAVALAEDNGFLMGERCCAIEGPEFADQEVVIGRYDQRGILRDTSGTFWLSRTGLLDAELRFVGEPIFGSRAAFAIMHGDTLVYAPGREEQLELWSSDGTLGRIIRWSGRDRRVGGEDVAEWKRRFRESFAGDLSSVQSRAVLDAQVGGQRPVAELFPAHDEWNGLLVTRGGEFWVKEYRRPFDEGPDRWLVFRQDGEFACRVMVPEGLHVLDVGENHVLGVERDALGVEYVVKLNR